MVGTKDPYRHPENPLSLRKIIFSPGKFSLVPLFIIIAFLAISACQIQPAPTLEVPSTPYEEPSPAENAVTRSDSSAASDVSLPYRAPSFNTPENASPVYNTPQPQPEPIQVAPAPANVEPLPPTPLPLVEGKYATGALISPPEKISAVPSKAPPAMGDLPQAYDIRNNGFIFEIKDQGQQGSCVAQASAYLMEYLQSQEFGWGMRQFSPASIYAVRPNQGEGMYPTDALNILLNQGIAFESSLPYDPFQDRRLSSQTVLDEASRFRIRQYYNVLDPYNLQNTLKAWLAAGYPILISMEVHSDALGDGVMHAFERTGMTSLHAVLLIAYDENGLTFVNSWGNYWGNGGYGRIDWDTISIIREAYTVEDADSPQSLQSVELNAPTQVEASQVFDISHTITDLDGDVLDTIIRWNGQESAFGSQLTAPSQAGQYSLEVIAKDRRSRNSQTVSAQQLVEVKAPPNQAPQIGSIQVNPWNPVSTDGNAVSVEVFVSASDPDGDAVSLSWQKDGELIYSNQAHLNVILPVGTHVYRIFATDSKGAQSSPQNATIVVQDGRLPEPSCEYEYEITPAIQTDGTSYWNGVPQLRVETRFKHGTCSLVEFQVTKLDGGAFSENNSLLLLVGSDTPTVGNVRATVNVDAGDLMASMLLDLAYTDQQWESSGKDFLIRAQNESGGFSVTAPIHITRRALR